MKHFVMLRYYINTFHRLCCFFAPKKEFFGAKYLNFVLPFVPLPTKYRI